MSDVTVPTGSVPEDDPPPKRGWPPSAKVLLGALLVLVVVGGVAVLASSGGGGDDQETIVAKDAKASTTSPSTTTSSMSGTASTTPTIASGPSAGGGKASAPPPAVAEGGAPAEESPTLPAAIPLVDEPVFSSVSVPASYACGIDVGPANVAISWTTTGATTVRITTSRPETFFDRPPSGSVNVAFNCETMNALSVSFAASGPGGTAVANRSFTITH